MVVGLTGGICTGKSLAAQTLHSAGAHVIDCDELARHFSNCDPAVRRQIRSRFGPGVFHRGGGLLRAELARIVFADQSERTALEGILHPPIIECVDRNIAAANADGEHLVIVVPLLFELRLEDRFDQTWLVACEPQTQLSRLMSRSGFSAEEAARWIAAQWPQAKKIPLASRVLTNDAKIEDFQAAVREIWEGVLNS